MTTTTTLRRCRLCHDWTGESARFCGTCGKPLAAPRPWRGGWRPSVVLALSLLGFVGVAEGFSAYRAGLLGPKIGTILPSGYPATGFDLAANTLSDAAGNRYDRAALPLVSTTPERPLPSPGQSAEEYVRSWQRTVLCPVCGGHRSVYTPAGTEVACGYCYGRGYLYAAELHR